MPTAQAYQQTLFLVARVWQWIVCSVFLHDIGSDLLRARRSRPKDAFKVAFLCLPLCEYFSVFWPKDKTEGAKSSQSRFEVTLQRVVPDISQFQLDLRRQQVVQEVRNSSITILSSQ